MFKYLHGYRSLQWGNEQFSTEKDTYERAFKKTFRKAQHYRMTHGYGVMRDSAVQLRRVLNTIDAPMMAAFVVMPGPKTDTGLPIYYLAFVQCDSEELVRDVYLVGESGTFCFEQPPPKVQPSGWQYTIKPPVPSYTYPGNLVMQITRARGDNRELIVSAEPKPSMEDQKVWCFPNASDLAPRRLINCANLITSLGTDADELRRYVCALDLHEKETAHGLFSKMTESQTAIVNELLGTLSPSQLGAFEHIRQSKHDIVFIQGPPGTGKTTFIVTFLIILWQLNHSWIACAPSNSATDHLATVLQQNVQRWVQFVSTHMTTKLALSVAKKECPRAKTRPKTTRKTTMRTSKHTCLQSNIDLHQVSRKYSMSCFTNAKSRMPSAQCFTTVQAHKKPLIMFTRSTLYAMGFHIYVSMSRTGLASVVL